MVNPSPLYLRFPPWLSPNIVPGLPLRWFGLFYVLAVLVTYLLDRREIKHAGIATGPEQTQKVFFWGLIGILVGGRLFATTLYDPTGYYLSKPWMILWPFDEQMRYVGLRGMSLHGGLLGAAISFSVYARVRRLDVLVWADRISTAAPMGFAVARIGNFVNAELLGRVTLAPWGVVFPTARRFSSTNEWVIRFSEQVGFELRDGTQLINLPRHPSQIYEALTQGLLLWLVLQLTRSRGRRFAGKASSHFLVGFGLLAFLNGYFREPPLGLGFIIELSSPPNPPYLLESIGNLSLHQLLSLGVILAGGVLWAARRRAHARRPHVRTFD
jgi:phosphatidylglycerol:prolipoprotein diacylglycerol transferase